MKHPFALHRHPRPQSAWRRRAGLIAMALAGGGLGWAALPHAAGLSAPPPPPAVRARFTLCDDRGGANCVVDGDTFRMGGAKIRIADIDTPETHPARCRREARLGAAATRRLHALLNSGAVSLARIDRDTDRYGRKLRIVAVDGRDVGDMLVAEGLARPYAGGYRAGWCG